MKNVRFFFHLVATSIRASMSKRAVFLFECFLMLLNNLLYFVLWWVFFRQFPDIRGWGISDIYIMMSILYGSFGIVQVFFAGVRTLGKSIQSGELDIFLTQPKNVLLHVIGSKSQSKGWGLMLTAMALLALSSKSLFSIGLALICMISCAWIVVSFNVIVNSLVFWIGSFGSLAKRYSDNLMLFSYYPTNIYSGFLQIVMFTFIPAGFIGYFPVEIVRGSSLAILGLQLLATLVFMTIAIGIFHLGLRRYESGNQFGTRL